MRFNVGDLVRTAAAPPVAVDPRCPIDWADMMSEYCGQQGRVSSVHETYYVVNFPDGQDWAYLPEWLAPAVDVGDEVSWCIDGPVFSGRVIGVGCEKLAVWPTPNLGPHPLFIKREWLVS